ncbi:MAG: hypothetical protein ACYC4L_12695 [Chloroflexota bacterium]
MALSLYVTGYELATWLAAALVLLCPAFCLLLYLQSKDTEARLVAAVGASQKQLVPSGGLRVTG